MHFTAAAVITPSGVPPMPHSKSAARSRRDRVQRGRHVAVGDQLTRPPASRIASIPSSWRGRSSTIGHHVVDVGALALGDQLDRLAERPVEVEQVRELVAARPSSPCRRSGPGSNIVPRSASAITAIALGMPERAQARALERVDGDVDERRRAVADLPRRCGASAPRPSRPRRSRRRRPCGSCARTACIPSTAAWSAATLSPRPIQRALASAAASVTRTSSSARLRSGAGLQLRTSPVACVCARPRWRAWRRRPSSG